MNRARQYAESTKAKNTKSRGYMKMNTKSGCVWAVVIVVYLFLVMISIFHVPMSLFLRMLPPIVVVVLLSKGKPIWVKSVVAGVLVLTGVYTLFYNDILGPMGFMIRDRPVDMPAQFYHSWRYYWVVCYLYEKLWRWGVLSVIFLLGYMIWIKWLKK